MAQGAAAREVEAAAASPRTVLLVMCVGSFLVLLDATIVNVALPAIGAGLDAGVSGLQWVVDGYAIALAGLMLGAGTAGDVHGHKRVVLCGLALFGLASLGCAPAPGITVLVAGRVLLGAGAAMLLPGTLAVVAHVFPDAAARAAAIGLWRGSAARRSPRGRSWAARSSSSRGGGRCSTSTSRSSRWPSRPPCGSCRRRPGRPAAGSTSRASCSARRCSASSPSR
jgi:sugar phosphate permease